MALLRPARLEPAHLSVNALLKLLTPVKPGMPWDDVLTAARINAIQTLLLQLTRGENVGGGNNILVRRFADSFSITARVPGFAGGSYKEPYVLGSTATGSGADGSTGPWGADAPLALDLAQTDTWHRDRPPTTYAASPGNRKVTDGVYPVLERIFIDLSGSGTYHRKVFRRKPLVDSWGLLVSVAAEVAVEEDTTSGSGSASGTV